MHSMADNLLIKFVSAFLLFTACQCLLACQTREQKAQASYDKCEKLHTEEKSEESIACFENFLKTNPEWGFSYNLLSRDYERLGQLDKAEEMIKIFISLYPLSDFGHRDYCDLLMEKGDIDGAFVECSRAVSINSKSELNWITSADVYEKRGEFVMAEYCYKTALEIKPNNDIALGVLGRFYENRGRFDEALEIYRKLLELNSPYSEKIEQRIREVEKRRQDGKQSKPEKPK
jgi:tetratricopeptide (TPR) repeat protein